jgi:hypothetical protein
MVIIQDLVLGLMAEFSVMASYYLFSSHIHTFYQNALDAGAPSKALAGAIMLWDLALPMLGVFLFIFILIAAFRTEQDSYYAGR